MLNCSAVRIESLPSMRVAYYRVASQKPEEDAARYLKAWYSRQNLNGAGRKFGFDIPVAAPHEAGLRGYEVWMSVPDHVQPSEGVGVKEFPGGLYAVMMLFKPFEEPFICISNGWKLLHNWVIESDCYRRATHQWLEEVLPQESDDDLKLYFPIRVVARGLLPNR